MKGSSIALALFIGGLMGVTAPAAAQTPINVSYQVTIHGIPLQIADDKDWWREIGLKPGDMTSFAAGAQQVAAVASKSWDVGLMGGPPALLGASRFNVQTVLILVMTRGQMGWSQRATRRLPYLPIPSRRLRGVTIWSRRTPLPTMPLSPAFANGACNRATSKPSTSRPVPS